MFKQGRNVLENEKINVFSQNSNKFSLDNHTLFFLYLEQLNNNLRGTQKRDVVATKEQVLFPGVSQLSAVIPAMKHMLRMLHYSLSKMFRNRPLCVT